MKYIVVIPGWGAIDRRVFATTEFKVEQQTLVMYSVAELDGYWSDRWSKPQTAIRHSMRIVLGPGWIVGEVSDTGKGIEP